MNHKKTKKIVILIPLMLLLFVVVFLYQSKVFISSPFFKQKNMDVFELTPGQIDFEKVLEESGDEKDSKSKNWWLNSGGQVFYEDGIIKTVQGELSGSNKWFNAYKKSTPIDTDGGLHPQNIFRLVNRNNLQNISQQAYFKINKTIMSDSPNRNESNGFLFFNRYVDGDNLYYAGIRVDGTAIIKKKKEGIYHTLDQKIVFEGDYQKTINPNLLPENQWIGLRSEIRNLNFKDVEIKVFIDKKGDGNWEQFAEAVDDGKRYNGASFVNAGKIGVRTDFMDIEFKDYSIKNL